MAQTVTVFKRKVWRKVRGEWEPAGDCRISIVRRSCEIEEARRICDEHNQHLPKKHTEAFYNFVFCEFSATL